MAISAAIPIVVAPLFVNVTLRIDEYLLKLPLSLSRVEL
jgi:hypothetical protein